MPVQASGLGCTAAYEARIDLRLPRLNAPPLWDAQYAPRGQSIEFSSAVGLADGTAVAAGRILDTAHGAVQNLLLVQLDAHGRAAMTAILPARPREQPVAMLMAGKSYVVLSNFVEGDLTLHRLARLAWYGPDGKFQREAVLQARANDYVATGFADDGKGGFVISLNSTDQQIGTKIGMMSRGVIMHVNAGGVRLWQRTYTPGIANEIDGIAVTAHGLVAAGGIQLDDGRQAGWAMQLTADGAIVWQQSIPRGRGAVFRRAAPLPGLLHGGQSLILTGVVKPSDGGPDALWFAALDSGGDILWQRFARHPNYGFDPVALHTAADGKIMALANAHTISGAGNRDHLRLLTLTPHGDLAKDDAYIEGAGAAAGDMTVLANGARLLSATVVTDDKPLDLQFQNGGFSVAGGKAPPAATPTLLKKGWVIMAPPAAAFTDPCAP